MIYPYTQASLFYQSVTDDIVNVLYACDPSSGQYQMVSANTVTSIPSTRDTDGSPGVHSQTGLAVALIGEKSGLSITSVGEQSGYRLFYHDKSRSVRELTAVSVNVPLWELNPLTLEEDPTGLAMYAISSETSGLYLVTPANESTGVQITRQDPNGNWHTCKFGCQRISSVIPPPLPPSGFSATGQASSNKRSGNTN